MLKKGAKILFISQYAGFIGGLEKYIYSVASLLRQNGFKTACLYAEKTGNFEKFASAFDDVFDMSCLSKISEADFDFTTMHKISEPALLLKILRRFSPTLFVHDHDYYCPKGYKYYFYKRLNCRRAYCPVFCAACASIVPPRHFAAAPFKFFKKNFYDAPRLFNRAMRCPKFVVLSEFMKAQLLHNGVEENDITILHPFIEIPAETRAQENARNVKPSILFAGQQVMSKGTPFFLEAVKAMKTDADVFIIGHGPRLEDFKKLSEDMGLKDKVRFEGWVQNPSAYFERASVLAFPSMWQEPFGLSGVEALAYGKPVVGFDVGGVSEWLKDGVNGLLVPERDALKMAAAFDRLLGDDALRLSLGQNGRAGVINNYGKEKFLSNFLNLK